MPRAEDGKHRQTSKDEAAQGQRGRAARSERNAENIRRATGRDPEHPVAGSQRWADKKAREKDEGEK